MLLSMMGLQLLRQGACLCSAIIRVNTCTPAMQPLPTLTLTAVRLAKLPATNWQRVALNCTRRCKSPMLLLLVHVPCWIPGVQHRAGGCRSVCAANVASNAATFKTAIHPMDQASSFLRTAKAQHGNKLKAGGFVARMVLCIASLTDHACPRLHKA
jgi:hypothetical protein